MNTGQVNFGYPSYGGNYHIFLIEVSKGFFLLVEEIKPITSVKPCSQYSSLLTIRLVFPGF